MTRVMETVRWFIEYQYSTNPDITLARFYALEQFSYTLHPNLLSFVESERENIIQLLEAELNDIAVSRQHGLIHLFLLHTQSYLYRNNQFISLSADDNSALVQVYVEYIRDVINALCDDNIDLADHFYKAIINHLRAFQAFISRLALSHQPLISNQVVCAEYSPSLQLAVLGITTLEEAVLDVGCGTNGKLVAYLRAIGLEAYGLDRVVDLTPYLIEMDWLQFSFVPQMWGSIISHLAFSHHFLFHHRYSNGNPEVFAQKYMQILRSLKVGGTFYYAPALPFVEQFLPPAFAVQSVFHPVTSSTHVTKH